MLPHGSGGSYTPLDRRWFRAGIPGGSGMRNTRTKEQLERLRLRDRTGGVQEEQKGGDSGAKLEDAMTKGISLSCLVLQNQGMC